MVLKQSEYKFDDDAAFDITKVVDSQIKAAVAKIQVYIPQIGFAYRGPNLFCIIVAAGPDFCVARGGFFQPGHAHEQTCDSI